MIRIPRLEPISRWSIIIRSCSVSNGLYLPQPRNFLTNSSQVPKHLQLGQDRKQVWYLDSLVDGVLNLVEDGAPGAEGGPERVFHLERDQPGLASRHTHRYHWLEILQGTAREK